MFNGCAMRRGGSAALPKHPSRRLPAIALITAALAGLLQPAEAADNITVTPAAATTAEDVNAPGAGWTFDTAASWFPAGWNGAYTYHTAGCATVRITGAGGTPWSLSAYYTTSPAAPVNVAVAQAGMGSCGTPVSAGTPLSANPGSPTTLLTNQSGNQTIDYFVVVQPTVALTSPTAITITFTVSGKSVNSGTLAITISPGNAFAVVVTPAGTGFAQDTTSPGPGWAFNTGAAWFPSGWSGAYTYYTGGCVAVQVKTSVQGWSLTAYYTTNPSTPINLAVAHAGTGNVCGTPAAAGTPVSANSGSPTTLLTAQNGTHTVNYYIVAQPTVAVTSNVTVTTTFTSR